MSTQLSVVPEIFLILGTLTCTKLSTLPPCRGAISTESYGSSGLESMTEMIQHTTGVSEKSAIFKILANSR